MNANVPLNKLMAVKENPIKIALIAFHWTIYRSVMRRENKNELNCDTKTSFSIYAMPCHCALFSTRCNFNVFIPHFLSGRNSLEINTALEINTNWRHWFLATENPIKKKTNYLFNEVYLSFFFIIRINANGIDGRKRFIKWQWWHTKKRFQLTDVFEHIFSIFFMFAGIFMHRLHYFHEFCINVHASLALFASTVAIEA